jgi:hypothetical protein
MAAVADYDRDGLLDVYIVRMGDYEKTTPKPNYEASNGLADQLLHNNGDGTFTDVTRRAGVGDTGWGLAGAWADYDETATPTSTSPTSTGSRCCTTIAATARSKT